MKHYSMMMNENDEIKLEKLCDAIGLSTQRGKSIAIRRLINNARVNGTTPELDELPHKESIELIRAEFGRMARLGGNLNQLIHLLQIRKIKLDCGEAEELVVDADFLVAVLKEINKEVNNIKAMMEDLVRKY